MTPWVKSGPRWVGKLLTWPWPWPCLKTWPWPEASYQFHLDAYWFVQVITSAPGLATSEVQLSFDQGVATFMLLLVSIFLIVILIHLLLLIGGVFCWGPRSYTTSSVGESMTLCRGWKATKVLSSMMLIWPDLMQGGPHCFCDHPFPGSKCWRLYESCGD